MKRSVLLPFLIMGLLISAAVSSAQDAAPTLDPNRYSSLPQQINLRGFPQIGYPNAPVSVVIYAAFDDPASGVFWRDHFPAALARVRTGEVLLTFVPLAGRGNIPTGRGAARAAICAGEQNAFWSFQDTLFTYQLNYGDQAYAGERLIEAASQSSINRAEWDQCMLSDRADAVLTEAEATVASNSIPITTPFVTVNDVPTLPTASSIEAGIQLAVNRGVATFEAALAVTESPEGTVDPNATEEIVVTLPPLLGTSYPPPLIIGLPPGWQYGYDTLALQDFDAMRNVPIAVYTGPVTGGTGTIVLMWGFPNLIPVSGVDGGVEPNLWADGLRLLRLAIVEQDCNIGTDLRREYSIGGLTAVGTQFAAVSCPELPDTRGWFAGLQQFNLNFVFYTFTDPIEAMDGAAASELQRILDSVRFVEPATPTPTTAP